MQEEDLVRSFVRMWREGVQPRPSDAECWRIDRALRKEFGGEKFYVLSNATVDACARRKATR